MADSENKKAVKNAVALTLRMILVTIVGLYTSRVVLGVLGVSDYGIFGVVGGVIGMASFLNATMSRATSRFITYELGKNDPVRLRQVFSTAFFIHLAIAVVAVIFAETVGLWFLHNKMNYPPERSFAVDVLYQLSVFSILISFTQVPYSACIIAHERMKIYAYYEILFVVLKLMIVYALLITQSDRLILYGVLSTIVGLFSAVLYRSYCLRHFKESHLTMHINKKSAKEMMTYSGYIMYGTTTFMVRDQSIPIVLNMFFGVIANAATSIAATVSGTVEGFTGAVAQSFRPQIIKQYAREEIRDMEVTMRRSVQFSVLAFMLLGIPMIVETETLLFVWLGQIPEYTVSFFRLILITSMINILVNANNTAIQASGKIKNISFISGSFYLLTPVVAYAMFYMGFSHAWLIYAVNAGMIFSVLMLGFRFIKLAIPEFRCGGYVSSMFKSLMVIAVSLMLSWWISGILSSHVAFDSWWAKIGKLAVTSVFNAVVLTGLSLFIAFSPSERSYFIGFVSRKIHNFKSNLLVNL